MLLYKLGTPKRNELTVYLHESKSQHSSSESQYLKRMIAGPGDTLRLVNQIVSVNGEEVKHYDTLFDYYVQVNKTGLRKAQQEQLKLERGGLVNSDKLYAYSLSESQATALAEEPNVEYVERKVFPKGIPGKKIAQFAQDAKSLKWNADTFGPFVCPKKGQGFVLNDEHLNIYATLLQQFEQQSVKKVDELFYVNDILADSVYFTKDYYFFLGDNRHQSTDSRHYGCIPKEKLLGTAIPLP